MGAPALGALDGLRHRAHACVPALARDLARGADGGLLRRPQGRAQDPAGRRQASYLRPFREAWEAAEKKAREAQPAQVASAEGAQPHLDFEILDVDRGQQVADEPPFARDGGDWTVCTCRLAAGSRAAFYFAERSGEPKDGIPFAWGEARLWVPSAGDGAELAEAIGDAFRVTRGRSRVAASAPARPLAFGTVVLSRATAPQPDGSFAGSGSWTASKWSYEEAIEVYVNWSLEEKKGRFAEKDEDGRSRSTPSSARSSADRLAGARPRGQGRELGSGAR